MFFFGCGYFYLWWDPNGDNGYGQIVINSLHPFDVYCDPNSRDIDCQDGDIFVSKMLKRKRAKILWPQYGDIIDQTIADIDTKMPSTLLEGEESQQILDEVYDSTRDQIRFTEHYEHIQTPFDSLR